MRYLSKSAYTGSYQPESFLSEDEPMGELDRLNGRRGQVIVLFCGAFMLLCLACALATDVGHLVMWRTQLQNAADAAALAAVMELWDQRADGANENGARAAALQDATSIAQTNAPGSRVEVVFGDWDGTQVIPLTDSYSADGVVVRAIRDADAPGGPVETFIASLLGLHTVEAQARAVARFRPKRLIPFSIYEPLIGGPGDPLTLYDDNLVTPGVFGLLDFNGGENATSDQVLWTTEGYQGPLNIDPVTGGIIIEGNTGWVDALSTPVSEHIEAGDTVVACVYDSVSGTGANTIFGIVGFVELVLTGQGKENIDGNPTKYVTAEVVGEYVPGTGETVGSMSGFMKLQLVQ
jgi:hypothetical protein